MVLIITNLFFFYISFSRQPDKPIIQLCTYINSSEKLFSIFANFCAIKSYENTQHDEEHQQSKETQSTGNICYGAVVRYVLLGLQEGGQKVPLLLCIGYLNLFNDHH